MGLSGRFFVRNVCAVGAAFGVALLLLTAFNSLSPWLTGATGSALAVQRAWSEIRYLAENEGSEELLRPQTQSALTEICHAADSEWLLLRRPNGFEAQLLYKSFAIEATDLPTLLRAAAAGERYRHGWRNLQVRSLPLTFDGDQSGELLFLAPPTEQLGLERELVVVGLAAFCLSFTLASVWLWRWLRSSVTEPLVQLRRAALELTIGEQLPEIPGEGEGEVAELAVALEQLRLRLKESVRLQEKSDQERSFLISSISHDLKTPLTAITGYLEAIQMPELPEERRVYYIQSAGSKAEQLRYMIDDLLLYSKLESQQAPLDLVPTDVGDFFADAVLEHRPLFERGGVELLFSDRIESPNTVSLDRERFRRVLQNVLDNARRFAPRESGRVEALLRASRSDVLLEVSDNGPGLAQGDHERIFERFYRSDAARGGQGSGLGLAIARQIVNAHGGRIWAREAQPNRGCTIIISLPIANREAFATDSSSTYNDHKGESG